jgi:Fibronectin type III domain
MALSVKPCTPGRWVVAVALMLASVGGSLGMFFTPAGASAPISGTISPYASLPNPIDSYIALTVDSSGNLYTVDSTSCAVIKIDAATQISSVISTNSNQWCSVNFNMTYAVINGTPTLIIADYSEGGIFEVPTVGGIVEEVATEAWPSGVAYDSTTDTLYVADYGTGNNEPIWTISSFSSCTPTRQCAAENLATAGVDSIWGLLLQDGILYSEPNNGVGCSLLGSVPSSGGQWTDSYDTVGCGGAYQDGSPTADFLGNIYYLDNNNTNVMVLPSATGSASVLALTGSPALSNPVGGPVYFDGSLYVIDIDNYGDRWIRRIGLPIPPEAPASVSATASDGSATVTWSAASRAMNYTVTASPGGETCTATAPATSCTVTGLSNGTAYTFSVTATNGNGTSGPSLPSAAVTPTGAATPAREASLAKTGLPLDSMLLASFGALGLGTLVIARRRRFSS